MKKIIIILTLAITAKCGYGQEAEENLKNFRFGLKAIPSLNWYKPDDKKSFASAGVRGKFSYGLITEFRLTNVASISTGLQVEHDGGRLEFKDSVAYIISNEEIIEIKDTAGKKFDVLLLKERKYNAQYLTIPFSIKMKTKEIGYLTYFGMFGINTSFRLKTRVDDETVSFTTGQASDQTDLDNTKDMQLFKMALNVGIGAEYNISGTTSLVASINYLNGFTNVLKGDSRYLHDIDNAQVSKLKQKATSNGIGLTIGVLF